MESWELNLLNYKPEKPKEDTLKGNFKWKSIPIVGIRDKKIFYFDSSFHAARALKVKNIITCARNIQRVCHGERKTLKGIMWFFADDIEKYKNLL